MFFPDGSRLVTEAAPNFFELLHLFEVFPGLGTGAEGDEVGRPGRFGQAGLPRLALRPAGADQEKRDQQRTGDGQQQVRDRAPGPASRTQLPDGQPGQLQGDPQACKGGDQAVRPCPVGGIVHLGDAADTQAVKLVVAVGGRLLEGFIRGQENRPEAVGAIDGLRLVRERRLKGAAAMRAGEASAFHALTVARSGGFDHNQAGVARRSPEVEPGAGRGYRWAGAE